MFAPPTPAQQDAALAYVQRAECDAAAIPDAADGAGSRPIERAGVIGAGTMGGGIAMALADIGVRVTLIDPNEQALAKGMSLIERNYGISVSRGRLDLAEANASRARIGGSGTLADIADSDIVIEAAPEDMALKRRLFAAIDQVVRPGAILATNTSGLNIDEIAAATARPADVAGAHFFAPANVMRLLEVVRAARTSPDVVATLMTLGRRMGKVAVQARVSPGFIGNAMMRHGLREAIFLVEEGATPRQVDDVLTGFGFAMGTFTVGDMAGNDVGIDQARRDRATRDPALRYPDLRIALCDHGRLGQKAGLGWYRYEPGDRTPHHDPALAPIVADYSRRHGIAQRDIPTEEILERCLLGLVNEGARLIDNKVALRSGDVDIVYVTGYGFPAWRGGPLYMADQIGLERIVERIRSYQAPDRPWWTVAPLLAGLAESGGKFGDLHSSS